MEAVRRRRLEIELGLDFLVLVLFSVGAEARCRRGCNLALASYTVWQEANMTFISKIFAASVDDILNFNPQVPHRDYIETGSRMNIPFPCDCINEEFLGHRFEFSVTTGDTYDGVAKLYYSNLTTIEWLRNQNNYEAEPIPINTRLTVTVNCSCGDSSVSKDYGLFVTYPLHPGESLSSVATNNSLPSALLERYNPDYVSLGSELVFIPGKEQTGNYPALKLSANGISTGVTAGISVAGVAAALFLAVCVYVGVYRRKKVKEASLRPSATEDHSIQHGHGFGSTLDKTTENVALVGGASPALTSISVDKSVEFSYEELANATDNFSMAYKIGEGGFGVVYYAEIRGEKTAIKKMDMEASKEFLAELKVLTHVHHLNLVRLIGYCTKGSLFLVYEFIDNGNLSQHLRGSGRDPLPWSTRVQIALDSARGLEYIHWHTVPMYIHRDIKSANILIDKNFHGKVVDFGLTKLTGGASLPTRRLVGTFGYMPPEYAKYGAVSPKIDVYAFGVVLYELISAREAVLKMNIPTDEATGLVALFEDVLSQPDPIEDLKKLVDPRLGDNYPLESVHKIAQLAKACTQENPHLRPSMRSVVVALMTLSSSTGDWDIGNFENQAQVNLASGR